MEEGAYVQEKDQLPALYILRQIGLCGEHRQFLHHKTHRQVQEKVIKDKATEDFDDNLAGKKPRQEMPDRKAHYEGGSQQVDYQKTEE